MENTQHTYLEELELEQEAPGLLGNLLLNLNEIGTSYFNITSPFAHAAVELIYGHPEIYIFGVASLTWLAHFGRYCYVQRQINHLRQERANLAAEHDMPAPSRPRRTAHIPSPERQSAISEDFSLRQRTRDYYSDAQYARTPVSIENLQPSRPTAHITMAESPSQEEQSIQPRTRKGLMCTSRHGRRHRISKS